jgi:hypothetical protein
MALVDEVYNRTPVRNRGFYLIDSIHVEIPKYIMKFKFHISGKFGNMTRLIENFKVVPG